MTTTEIIQQIFSLTKTLESRYLGRHFTPDGHLLGSIGEVYAAERYGLTLYEASHEIHDAVGEDGREVQIKITQTDRISLSSKPDFLIVLKIDENGVIKEVYNGLGEEPWAKCGKMQKNGQRMISLKKMKLIKVEDADRIG